MSDKFLDALVVSVQLQKLYLPHCGSRTEQVLQAMAIEVKIVVNLRVRSSQKSVCVNSIGSNNTTTGIKIADSTKPGGGGQFQNNSGFYDVFFTQPKLRPLA